MSEPQFIQLRVHSSYSLLEGALKVDQLVEYCKGFHIPALGITDRNNLFGALEFSQKMMKTGAQPIIGLTADVSFQSTDIFSKSADQYAGLKDANLIKADGTLVFIAKSEAGYQNLLKIATKAYLNENDQAEPIIQWEDIAQNNRDLIVLTGGPEGVLNQALVKGDDEGARSLLKLLKQSFPGHLYIELQRHNLKIEQQVEPKLLEFADQFSLPLVATNQCYFKKREDFEAHDALICIKEGTYVSVDERRRLTPEHYLKTPREMVRLFEDIPEAIQNSLQIAKRCSYCPQTHPPILPVFIKNADKLSKEEQLSREAEGLKEAAHQGLKERLKINPLAEGFSQKDYKDRLDFELDIITKMKFPGYFLIVSDFIKWAKSKSIAVGPGRGSGAGSLVAWALQITDIDPLRFGLLFERFLNPERVSMPDFDIDFCQTRREEVIQYVQEKYGADRVAQIITFGKLQARAVLRDVGRVLHMPYGQVDRLCKLIPNNPANPMSLKEAIDFEPRLKEEARHEKVVETLLKIGQRLEGLYRHASTHAAGVVIGDRPLVDLIPLYRDPRSPLPVTQFNMKWVEPAGLVKFDFLGLKTLTVLEKAKELLARRGVEIDFAKIPLDDKPVFELLSAGNTIGVFQLESAGMRDSLKRLKPDRFEDIIAMVSLYRPGPMDNIPTYIARKHGEEEPDYLHDKLQTVLEETYGVIIYQEQVMQIAQILSGYSLGEADMLRRAMGKKIQAEMNAQKKRFVEGAKTRGVEQKQAASIFELVDKFAGYGFNKSHAAAYSLVSYHTAYIKTHYPVEFLAASMSFDMNNSDKLSAFLNEARRMEIKISPPDINRSEVDFLSGENEIIYSLAALKNVGAQAVQSIVDERRAKGDFKSLSDFAQRVDPKFLNKRSIETLAASGAFDKLMPDRAQIHNGAEMIMGLANKTQADKDVGQDDLFGGGAAAEEMGASLDLKPVKAWNKIEKLTYEFDAIGSYLTGHPLDEFTPLYDKLNIMDYTKFEQAAQQGERAGIVAGVVVGLSERRGKSGKPYGFLALSDRSSSFEFMIFSDVLESARDLLTPGTPVMARLEADIDEDRFRVRGLLVKSLNEEMAKLIKGMRVTINDVTALEKIRTLNIPRGRNEIILRLNLEKQDKQVDVQLPGKYLVNAALKEQLEQLKTIISIEDYS